MKVKACVFSLLLLSMMAVSSANAMGHGQGRTKIDFKTSLGDSGASSRLFAKLDVKSAIDAMPDAGGKTKNDNLAGQTINLIIGTSATFSGTANDKGKVTTPFDAKLTANGGILQIKASGLNLEQLFPLDPTDGSHSVTVSLKVTASSTDATTGVVTTVTLSEQNVIFQYTVKNSQAKGKNF
jgi:hypothetical protein